MTKNEITKCAEGLIVTVAGIVFTVLSLQIRNNPISLDGPLNMLVQAKFIPLLLSILITVLGAVLTVALWKGRDTAVSQACLTPRALMVTSLTVAYLVIVSYIGFAIPTVVYMGAMLFLLNKDKKPLHLLLLTVVYSIIALLLIPGVLNLQLL